MCIEDCMKDGAGPSREESDEDDDDEEALLKQKCQP